MKVLTAAYGRTYATAAEVEKAYRRGQDFMWREFIDNVSDGNTYCSCRDFPGETVELRYGSHEQHLTVIKGESP